MKIRLALKNGSMIRFIVTDYPDSIYSESGEENQQFFYIY